MMNHDILANQLIYHEGLRLKPYKDTVGKLTIGIGRNLTNVGISEVEARFLLENDVTNIIKQLDNSIPWWRDQSEVRQHVLLDMAFNLGIAGLLQFKNTLIMIQYGNYELAAKGMLQSKWATQVGKRAIRLSEMMKTNEFPMKE